jgi:predicted NUDIX family phosphoesterase
MEQVLVIERDKFDSRDLQQGFISPDVKSDHTIPFGAAFFIDRDKAEINPDYKQLIPQMVIRRKNGDIFLVQRLKTQGESRLHGRHSIGIGGHINPIDVNENLELDEYTAGVEAFNAGMVRELNEEILVYGDVDFEYIGAMNDDSDDVGKVHYAIVYTIIVDDDIVVEINETDKMVGGFVSMEEAATHFDNMENWSKIIFNQLKKG